MDLEQVRYWCRKLRRCISLVVWSTCADGHLLLLRADAVPTAGAIFKEAVVECISSEAAADTIATLTID